MPNIIKQISGIENPKTIKVEEEKPRKKSSTVKTSVFEEEAKQVLPIKQGGK